MLLYYTCTRKVKPVLRGHLWGKEKVVFRGLNHMKFSMTGQEKGDL